MKKNDTSEVKEKVEVQKVEEKGKSKFDFSKISKKWIAIGVVALVVIAVLFAFIFRTKVDTITKVKKVASTKFYNVECLSSSCDYILAAQGNSLGKSKIYIYDANGRRVAKYKNSFYKEKDYAIQVSDVSKNYILFKQLNRTTNEKVGYILASNKGKNRYSTANTLKKINDNLISEYDKKDGSYLILNNRGKILYQRVQSINKYADGKVVSLNSKNNDIIVDENGNTILNGFSVSKEVFSFDNETLYLILSDSKANAFYYYDINSGKIVGDGFNGYISNGEDGEYIITKRENNSTSKYKLDASGKQTKISDDTLNERITFIKEKIGGDYALYVSSVLKADQRYVFVNKIKDSSFGVYDVNSGNYNKLYNYSSDDKSTIIYDLDSSKDGIYMQSTCYKGYCDKTIVYVYDLNSNRQLYKAEGDDLVLQKYAEYTNGYKVIKYSSSSNNDKYKGKYVLYNSKNKELVVSSNTIVPVGEENIFGEVLSSKALILYSTKDKKVLNDDNYLGSKINVSGTPIYKYSDAKNTYLYSDKGKKLVSIKISDAKLLYSDETIVYILNNKVNIVDPTSGRTRKYSLKKDEKLNDLSGDTIPPYRNSLFVNNTVKGYVKVVNVNGITLKKVRKAEIKSVVKNEKTNNVVIIVKRIKNNNNLFGLYIAK